MDPIRFVPASNASPLGSLTGLTPAYLTAFLITAGLVLVVFVLVLCLAIRQAVAGTAGPPAPASRPAQSPGLMPLGLHFTLVLLLSIASFFGGLVLLTVCLSNWGLRFPLNFILGGAMGIVFPQVLFGELLSAKCPSCGGRSFLSWGRHMNYVCRNCSYVHVTGVSRGGARRGQRARSDAAAAARRFGPGNSVRTSLSFVFVLVVLFMYYSALSSPAPAPQPQTTSQSDPGNASPGA